MEISWNFVSLEKWEPCDVNLRLNTVLQNTHSKEYCSCYTLKLRVFKR